MIISFKKNTLTKKTPEVRKKFAANTLNESFRYRPTTAQSTD